MFGPCEEKQLQEYYENKRIIEEANDFPRNIRELLDLAVGYEDNQFLLNFFDQQRQLDAKQLQEQVYRLADSLVAMGVKLGDRVALLMGNRIEFPVTMLALGVLGAAMQPLNNRLTSKELDYFINDAEVDMIITESQYIGLIDGMESRPATLTPSRIILVSELDSTQLPKGFTSWDGMVERGCSDYRPEWDVEPESLLSVQYTSGSTGLPKGCMLSQRYFMIFGAQLMLFRKDDPIRSMLIDHSFFYIDPQWQLMAMLYGNGQAHVASGPSGSRFVKRLREWDIEYALTPRPLFGEMGSPEDRNLPIKKLSAVAAGADIVRHIRRRFNAFVSDDYGMTELGIILRSPDAMDPAVFDGTCGVPALFREVKVLRSDNTECDTGEPGELVVRGEGIFLGYYNKPEVTAKEFVDGWFRTGDLGVRSEHGFYSIVGRVKDIIRRSSENISALQVEQALTQVEGVKQVAVIAVPDDYRGEEVKAYLLLEENESQSQVTPTKVIEACKAYLPDFKLPRYIEYVNDFPYTPSLKVAKPKLIANKENLLTGSWDHLNQSWVQ
jgi:acyl-CoA synthetase (AMP-forming)/AMP-acid ligase II